MKEKNRQANKKLVVTVVMAMLSAVSFVLYLLEFPIFPALGHLKLDLSDIPALFGGIMYGPISAVIIELIKNLLELVTKGLGSQMGFGNIMNFLVGCAFTVPFSLIYRNWKKKLTKNEESKTEKKNGETKTLVIAGVVGVITIIAVGFVGNYFIDPPFFKYFLGVELDSKTLWAAIGSATVLNAVKGVMLAVLTFPITKLIVNRLAKYTAIR